MEVAAPKIKKGYKQTEVGVIPEDWNFEELKGFVQTFIVPMRDKPKQFGGSIPWCRIEDFDGMYLEKSKSGNCVTEQTIKEMNLGVNPVGTVLVSCSTVAGVSAIVKKPLVTNQTFIGLVPNELINNQFLYHLMRHEGPRMMREASGTTIVYISREKFEKFKIALPSNTLEQSKIAESLTDTDELIKSLDALIEKKKNIKTATMQQLLTGKTRLPGFSGEWVTKKLGELGELSGAGVDKKIRPDEPLVRLVNFMDVFRRDFIYSKDLNHVVSASVEQVARCAVHKGDIFFTPSSEMPFDIAISAVAMEDIPDACYSYHLVRLHLDEDWDLNFRAYAFKTKDFLNQAARTCEGSGVRYVITQGKFRQLTVCYPADLLEQAAIGEVLVAIDDELTALQKRRDKLIAIKQGMMHELLTGNTRLV